MIATRYDTGSQYVYANAMAPVVQPEVKNRVDAVLSRAAPQDVQRAYQVVQENVDRSGGLDAIARSPYQELTEMTVRVLMANGFEVAARPRTAQAVDRQIKQDATPEERLKAYEYCEIRVTNLEKTLPRMEGATLELAVADMMREGGIETRHHRDVVGAVVSQLDLPVSAELTLKAYDLVQRDWDSSASRPSREQLRDTAKQLLLRENIPLKIANVGDLLETLQRRFETMDTALELSGREVDADGQLEPLTPDGLIGIDDLKTISANRQHHWQDTSRAASLLLDNEALRNYLDTGGGASRADGAIGYGDVTALLDRVRSGELNSQTLLGAISDVAAGNGTADGITGSNDVDAMNRSEDVPKLLGIEPIQARGIEYGFELLSLSSYSSRADVIATTVQNLTPENNSERLYWAAALDDAFSERGAFKDLPAEDKQRIADAFIGSKDVGTTRAEVRAALDLSDGAQRSNELQRIRDSNIPG